MKKSLTFAAFAILMAVWTLYDQTGDFEFLRRDFLGFCHGTQDQVPAAQGVFGLRVRRIIGR